MGYYSGRTTQQQGRTFSTFDHLVDVANWGPQRVPWVLTAMENVRVVPEKTRQLSLNHVRSLCRYCSRHARVIDTRPQRHGLQFTMRLGAVQKQANFLLSTTKKKVCVPVDDHCCR
jgi:hypothetical protein